MSGTEPAWVITGSTCRRMSPRHWPWPQLLTEKMSTPTLLAISSPLCIQAHTYTRTNTGCKLQMRLLEPFHGNQQCPLGTQQEALSGFWLMQISELGREHSLLFWILSPARIQLDHHRGRGFPGLPFCLHFH